MKRLLFILCFCVQASFLLNLHAQNKWIQKADYGGGARDEASGFAIGNRGYIFSGNDTGNYFMDMWSWSKDSNVWDQAATFPGGYRIGLQSVSLNGYGYVFCGEHPSNCFLLTGGGVCAGTFYSDVWRYNPTTDTWNSDATFPGAARDFAVAVADPDDSTIYYGTGNDNGGTYLSDWWAFYTPTHSWKQLTGFPGGARAFALGFFAAGKIYVGTGDDGDTSYNATNDVWQYSPSTDTWLKVTDIPGMPLRSASAFSIGNYGYICLGLNDRNYTSGGWRYNPIANSWQPTTNYSGGLMSDGVAFTIDSNGYIGTGIYGSNANSLFWEYTFDNSPALGVQTIVKTAIINLYPNPARNVVTLNYSGINSLPATLSFMDMLGNTVSSFPIQNESGQMSLDITGLSSGVYVYRVTAQANMLQTGKIVITK